MVAPPSGRPVFTSNTGGGKPTLDFSKIPTTTTASDEPKLILERKWFFDQTPSQVRTPNNDKVVSLSEGVNAWYEMDPEDRADFAESLYSAGLIRDPGDYDAALKMWTYAVQEAAGFYTYGKKKYTPWEMIRVMTDLRTENGGGGQEGTYFGPRSRTTTSKNTNIPSKTEIKSGVTAIFKESFGRAPTEAELRRYTSLFRRAAVKNPEVTTTTTKYDQWGEVSKSSQTSGGVNFTQLGVDEAQDDPEYGAYQAVTTYMNALLSAIGSP